MTAEPLRGCITHFLDTFRQSRPVGHCVLGLMKMADGSKTMGVTVAGFSEQDVSGPEVLLDLLQARCSRDGDSIWPRATSTATSARRLA